MQTKTKIKFSITETLEITKELKAFTSAYLKY